MFFSHPQLGLSSGLFCSDFPTQTLYAFLFSFISATCPSLLILFDLIAWMIFCDLQKSQSSPLCYFVHSCITSLSSTASCSWTPSAFGLPIRNHMPNSFCDQMEFHTILATYITVYITVVTYMLSSGTTFNERPNCWCYSKHYRVNK